jgi:hypothetical protein
MTSKKDPAGENVIEIDPTFAITLGLQHRQKVSLKCSHL